MEWVNLMDNAVDKIKKDGRDPDASEFLDLKAFVNSSGEPDDYLQALMHNICNEFVVDDDTEGIFPVWLVQGWCWFRFHSNGRTVPTTTGAARTGTDSGFSRWSRRIGSRSLPTSRAPFCQVPFSHAWADAIVCLQQGLEVRWLESLPPMHFVSSRESAW